MSQQEERYFGERSINEPKIIVFLTQLLSLFAVCNHSNCGAAVDPDNKSWTYSGAMITVTVLCNNNHKFTWSSSPTLREGKSKMAAVNVLIATYAYTCGVNFKKVIFYTALSFD